MNETCIDKDSTLSMQKREGWLAHHGILVGLATGFLCDFVGVDTGCFGFEFVQVQLGSFLGFGWDCFSLFCFTDFGLFLGPILVETACVCFGLACFWDCVGGCLGCCGGCLAFSRICLCFGVAGNCWHDGFGYKKPLLVVRPPQS